MSTIAIQTSQNIALEQSVASVGERILATILDVVFFLAYFFLITMFAGVMETPALIPILMIPVGLYHLIMEMAMNGQSFGKKIMKIKVVKADGTQPTFISYFLRWVFRLIDTSLLGSVATLTIILNGKGQRLGDMAAGTTVVRIKGQDVSETLFMKIPENYEPVFNEVEMLSEKDMYIVKEVLNFLKKTGRSIEARNMANKAREALVKKTGIETAMNSEKFLFTLLRDYNYQQSKSITS